MGNIKFAVSKISVVLVVGMSLLFSINTSAKTKFVAIGTPSEKILLKNYRITKIEDKRLDTKSIGYLTTGAHNYFLPASFRQTLPEELNQFVQENTVQSSKAEEVTLQVNEYFLSEKSSFKGAEILIVSHFTLFNKNGHRLLDQSSSHTRNTGMNMGANASEVMCRNMVASLTEMDAKVPGIIAMLKKDETIKISYAFVKEPIQKHLLPYNPQRPLNQFHFVAKVPEKADIPAQAQCGLIVNYQVRHIDGKPEAFVELLPYFDQSKSWIKKGENLQQRLAFEQTYFKISAFVTNELIKELEEKTFTFSTLKSGIDELREKYVAQMIALQTQYLAETDNGKNLASLEKWQRQIAFYPVYASR